MENPYEVLGVDPGASPAEVRASYKKLARLYRPDRYGEEPPHVQAFAATKMAEVNAAYRLLTNAGELAWFGTAA